MRKSFSLLGTGVVLLASAACSTFSNRGEVDRPFIGAANQTSFSIEKVELSDSSTTLHAIVHFPPGRWIRLADSSYISADGVDYTLESVDGITAGKRVTMPDSGVIHFAMTFPAIPAGVKSIDFAESKDSGWMLWGIDLSGEADYNLNAACVPSACRSLDPEATLPNIKTYFGDSTSVNVHILGYRPAMGRELYWALNTLHGQIGADTPAAIDSAGNATVRVALSAPAKFMAIGYDGYRSQLSGGTLLSPGETVDLYLDSHISGEWNMSERDGEGYEIPEEYYPFYASGEYENINRHMGNTYYGMQFRTGCFGDYRMNGDDYTRYVIEQYNALSDSLAADSTLTALGREINEINLKSDLIYAAVDAWNILRRNYYMTHGNWGSRVPPDTVAVALSPENAKAIAALVDFNDSNLLISRNVSDIGDTRLWEEAGIDPGVLKTIKLYNEAYEAANDARLDTAALGDLRKLSTPMADEVEAHYLARKARLEALDARKIAPTPEVAAEAIFDAIVSPHKGKVVMVDLWNTWCGPCRAAIAATEPEKNGSLSSDDIVWIYIADESSPLPDYLGMIKNIKGIHYRLSPEQIAVIRKRFEVDGIPYYILVDRSGKAVGRPDLREHSAFKSALKSAIE